MLGTTAATDNYVGDGMYLPLTSLHLNGMLNEVLAAEKYFGLVGADASKSATPDIDQVYIASDTNKMYFCFVDDVWQEVGGLSDHDELYNLDVDDHDTGANAYQNDARAVTWHDGLTGGHVQDDDDHDHSKGAGAGRVQSGTSGAKPGTPSYAEEIYLETDTGEMYIGKSDLSAWLPITGAPTGIIVAFSEAIITSEYSGACPSGWVEYTVFDGRFPKGAPTGVTTPLNTGGSATHDHDYTDIIAHVHNVPADSGSTDDPGTHQHSGANSSGGSGSALFWTSVSSFATRSTSSDGSHAHTAKSITTSATTTKKTSDDGAGVATGTSTSENGEPPYQEVVFCQKS